MQKLNYYLNINNVVESLSCTGSEDITVNYLTCDNEIKNTDLNVSGNTILNF